MSKSLLPKSKKSSANEDIEIVRKPSHSDDEQVLQKPLKKKSSKDKDLPIVAEVVDSEENNDDNIAIDEDILPKPKKQSTKKKTNSKKVAEAAEEEEAEAEVVDIVVSKDVVDTPKESKKKPSKQAAAKVVVEKDAISDVEDEVASEVASEAAIDTVKKPDSELLTDYLLNIPKMYKLLGQALTLVSKEQKKQLKSASKDAEKSAEIQNSINSLEFILTTISTHSKDSVKFVKISKDLSKKGSKKKSSTPSSVPKNVTLKPCKTDEFNQFVEDNLSIVGKKGPIFSEVPLKNEDGKYLISSTQVLKLLNAYIQVNNLSGQYPDNLSKIKIDDRLSEIFSEYIAKYPNKDIVYTSLMGTIPYLC